MPFKYLQVLEFLGLQNEFPVFTEDDLYTIVYYCIDHRAVIGCWLGVGENHLKGKRSHDAEII